MTDYFTVLGLKRSASDREIREAYRRLAKKYHPDSHPNDREGAGRMQAINEAKEVLFDPVKREEHKVTLSLKENFSSQHIEALRNDPRFQKTTTYRTPSPAMRRPSSKWDRLWRKYMVAFVAVITLGVIGIVVYEIASQPKMTTDPIKDIIARYEKLNRENTKSFETFDDSLGSSPAMLTATDTLRFPDDSAPKLRRLGDILLKLGEYRSAVKYYEMYLRKAPENDTVIGNLAYALFKRGQYAQTLEVLSREMHGDSNLVVAYYNIGEMFLKEDKPFDARDAFRAATHIADSMTRTGRHSQDEARRARKELERLE